MSIKKQKTWNLWVMAVIILTCTKSISNDSSENEPDEVFVEQSDALQVVSVASAGLENAYSFSVELRSPDTGCDQYADWWEVIDTNGTLLYRRILLHSHVNEQPFKRNGGPIDILSTTPVIIRGHMNNSSYSSFAMKGSVMDGFHQYTLESDFALDLETTEPLPDGCEF